MAALDAEIAFAGDQLSDLYTPEEVAEIESTYQTKKDLNEQIADVGATLSD